MKREISGMRTVMTNGKSLLRPYMTDDKSSQDQQNDIGTSNTTSFPWYELALHPGIGALIVTYTLMGFLIISTV